MTHRYQLVADRLAQEIASGTYDVGDELPTEEALGRDHGVSRHTVRAALEQLEDAGLIVRRQGSGSRVLARHPVPRFQLSLGSESEVLRYASETVLELRPPGSPSHRTAQELGLTDPQEWAAVDGIRRAGPGGPAICVTKVLLRGDVADVLEEVGPMATDAIFARVLAAHGLRLDHIEQTISATSLSATLARRLRAEPGSPALTIERRYVAAGRGLFEVSRSIHPGDRFTYSLRLDRP